LSNNCQHYRTINGINKIFTKKNNKLHISENVSTSAPNQLLLNSLKQFSSVPAQHEANAKEIRVISSNEKTRKVETPK